MRSLLVKNVRPMGGAVADVVVRDGIIEQVGAEIEPPPNIAVEDGENKLLLPGFVDGHMHLDKTLWGLPWHKHQAGPTLMDKIENEVAVLERLNHDAHAQSARLVRQCISKGTTHIRTHADINNTVGLKNFDGVMATREQLRDYIDIQVVAFPQTGLLIRPGVLELIEEALKQGADMVGGLDPAGIDRDPAGQLEAIFELAGRYGVGIDIHLHDRGELGALQVEMIAERTHALGLQGRVTISHAFCLGMVDDVRFQKLTEQLLENRIAIMTHGPGNVAFPPIERLSAAGVRLFSGSDGIRDSWGPFGNGDMLERAWILSYRSNFRRDEQVELALKMATWGGAEALGVEGYGIAAGDRADLVVVEGETLTEAVMNRAARSLVVKGGQIVAVGGECLI